MRLITKMTCGLLFTGVAFAIDIGSLLSGGSTSNIVCKDNVCDIYLLDEIKDPADYLDVYKTLAGAKTGDTINLHLAGPGGQGDGLVYLVNAIKNSKAKVVSVLDGSVASADAVLAVMNKDYIINGHVQVLFHSISISNMTDEVCRGTSGSDRGLAVYTKCMENYPKYTAFYNEVINEYVYPLLTDEERKDYDAGHDIIMDGKELKKRLDARGNKP